MAAFQKPCKQGKSGQVGQFWTSEWDMLHSHNHVFKNPLSLCYHQKWEKSFSHRIYRNYFQNTSIFISSFIILLFTELAVRYTGINTLIFYTFILMPFSLLLILYSVLIYKFSNESFKT